ncbi:MAG: hypothetical protein M0R80_02140 [Proteobacteria bacterium]|jgi:hypothetical protein|nr:hypothetical protein [Pseudomonadota bacterium]
MIGYKLFRMRKNGTLGSLFINRKAIIPIGQWIDAKEYPTKGYSFRPGWHIACAPCPHLSMKGRLWYKVEFKDYYEFKRPAGQGGKWYIAQKMRVLGR